MYLVFLMIVPLIIGAASMFFSKGRVTWKEFLLLELVVFLVLGVGYCASTYRDTTDYEVRSGRIVAKDSERVSCSHSYSCNCVTTCSGSGSSRSCTTICQTCYEHSFDMHWYVKTSLGETISIDNVTRQGLVMPPRWGKAYIKEPTSTTHYYKNYIKANPGSILRRVNAVEPFRKWLPEYPYTYDYYRATRFFSAGFNARDIREWDWLIDEMNSDLGARKQVNVIVGLVKNPSSDYQFALEEHWLGGKKNDVIVLIGVPEYPKISWVRIVTWSKSEDLKVYARDNIMAIGNVLYRDKIVHSLRSDILHYYQRRPMEDFAYLAEAVQPGPTGTMVLFIIGLLACLGLTWYFYHEDPFGDHYQPFPDYRSYL